jgi:UDP:flavonoid glycosyltransferase YjiC (YdhE family)
MPGCGTSIEQVVPTRFSHKLVPAVCGQTGIHGYHLFCDKCAPLYKDRNWRMEAEENGERWDDDY